MHRPLTENVPDHDLIMTGRLAAYAASEPSLLGTITISGGRHQVSYDGHPLYTYSGDPGPWQTAYIGSPQFGGTWYGLDAAGGKVQ